MIKLLKKSKFFLIFIIFLNISSLIASEINPLLNIRQAESKFSNQKDIIQQLMNEDGMLVYDRVMSLFEEIENGNLDDVLSEQNWHKINLFLAYIVRQGMLPNIDEEYRLELELDIQELLHQDNNSIFLEKSSNINGYQFLPVVFYQNANIVHYSNKWFKKQVHHSKKFIKKHKTIVIVTAVIAIAAVVVVATVVIASTAVASAGALTTAADSYASKKKKETFSDIISHENLNTGVKNDFQESVAEQTSDFKNIITQNDLAISRSTDINYFFPNERITGSTLAHNAFSNLTYDINSNNSDEILLKGHGEIDNIFVTNQTANYIDNKNTFSSNPNSFPENFHLPYAEFTSNKNYYQSIEHFDKAINLNPNNHNAYLNRAYAYLQLGEFDKSLNDYNNFKEIKEKNYISKSLDVLKDSAEFCVGARIGIDKGAMESGKQFLSLAVNVVSQPSQTYVNLVESIQIISDFAKLNEWKVLSEIIAPEACELIKDWEILSPKERGEKSGYIIGKLGGDILVPGIAAKVTTKGINGAKELLVAAKNLKMSEQLLSLEALAETGGNGAFREIVYSNRVFETAASTGKMIEGFSSKELANAGKVLDRAGLTKAGRALAKHGGREGSVFPKPIGDPMQINLHGQKILEGILNNPNKKIFHYTFKEYGEIIDIKVPEIGGLRYNIKGEFIGFLEP
ncbi:MAG: hypothetical protein K1060chlam5_00606 [Candidatus Anoxychlamydiales bacterium]|nr:hypothetical protein [Candidatus Anoxychlamydiales bacterium]